MVLTTPIVRCLKLQLGAEIHYLIKEGFHEVILGNPHIDKIHYYNPETSSNELTSEKYTHIIDLQKNRRSNALCKAIKAPSLSFNKLNIKKWILVQTGINLLPDKHIVDRYFEGLKGLVKNDGMGNELFVTEKAKTSVSKFSIPEQFAIIGAGAAHQGKSISASQIVKLTNQIKIPVLILGGHHEKEKILSVESKLGNHCRNLTGLTTLQETLALVKKSSIVISGDTGLMHIASAFMIPQISVWGCTDPVLGMKPYLPHPESVIIKAYNKQEKSCSKLGSKCCSYPDTCITQINTNVISEAVNSILKKQSF